MLYQQIAQNKRKTIYVLIGFYVLVGLMGAALGYFCYGRAMIGIAIAIGVGLFYMIMTLTQSTSIVMSMNNAHPVTEEQAPVLYHVVQDMAMVGKVPMPKVYIIDDPSPNAFATGPNPQHAAVAATTGLLERLNREELEGVIGHEISHIRNYDIRLQSTALALSSVISYLANLGVNSFFWGRINRDDDDNQSAILALIFSILTLILGPLAATFAQMALSRNREYLADAGSVELTRNPQGLIDALRAISDSEPMRNANTSSASLYIADPFKKSSWTHLFDTHPPIEKRIERLEHM
ncbi:zinc metalloprotease HtpX [Ligilactobacillus araffinosus]|uniref:Protease HtpX homolog n=1 Tax=Ligilactobacillus araffinosus DSM 20653 TaxID=1423820 RepID=A0A0R1ZB45_9LACO|nr:zinc metalloprotease HtpX [Ligilactobacillus araffinosus]KRM51599.1 heat shock protein HtpX [Ligilactobacillus araffinosus DSM 20653]